MMVFDGLDEISDEILWDIIPSSEMLDDGVYVLLTSRIFQEEPVTNNVKKHLTSLPVNTTFIINRDSDEYRQFLYSYTLTTNVGPLTEKEIIQLVTIADYRVLHLGMLCKLLENGLLLEDLHHYNRVFPAYLKTLNHRYGERGSIYVRELLATICILGIYEPLTIKNIGNLIGENGVTLKLVGALRDVAPVLKEERSQNGNVYVISNPDLNDEVRHHIPEIYDVAKELLQIGVSYLLEESPITPTTITEESGVELIMAHIFDFTLAFCPDQIAILDNRIVNSLKELCISLFTFSNSLKDRQLALQYAIQAYTISEYCNGSDSQNTWEIMELLIYLYHDIEDDTNRNALINKLYLSKKKVLGFNNAETLVQYARVISKQEDIDSCEKVKQLREVYEKTISIIGHDTQESIGILDLIAHELFKEKKFNEALRLGREVYDKRVSILGPEHPETIDAMYNLSIEYNNTGQQSKALELLYSAYEKQKELPSGITLGSSKVLTSIARIFIEIGYLDGAIDVFRDAYQHEIALLGKEHSETIKTGEDLALSLESANKYEEALAVMEDILISKESKYGKDSEICLETMDYIGSLYMDYGNYIERILPAQNTFHKKHIKQNTTSGKNADYNTFYFKSCNIKESVFKSAKALLGENHYLTLKYLSGLGKAKLYSGDYPEAYKLLSSAFLKQIDIFGKNDDETLITMDSLALAAFKVKKYDEAISLQKEVFEQLKQKESDKEELYYSISRLINICNEAHKDIDQSTWDEYKNIQKTWFLEFDKEHFPTSWERLKTTVSSLKDYGPYSKKIIDWKYSHFCDRFKKSDSLYEWVHSNYKDVSDIFPLMSIILLFAGLFHGDLSHMLHATHDSGIFAVIFYIIGTLLCLSIPVYLSKCTLRNVLPELSWKSDYRKLLEGYVVVAVYFFVFYLLYGLFFSKESAGYISQLGNKNTLKCLSQIFNKKGTEILINGYSNKKIITFVLVSLSHLYICGFDYITYQILTSEVETNPTVDNNNPNE